MLLMEHYVPTGVIQPLVSPSVADREKACDTNCIAELLNKCNPYSALGFMHKLEGEKLLKK